MPDARGAEDDVDAFDVAAALAACARGDRAAMRALYERESPRMLGVALRIVRDRARAEDVLHDACVNIWRRAASFDATRGDARGWIYTIVRHLALNAVRNDTREVVLDEPAAEAIEADRALEAYRDMPDVFALREELGRLRGCLEALEPVRRQCVLFAYLDGCSHAEIAQRVGAPLGTVKAWVRRSLASLRDCMA